MLSNTVILLKISPGDIKYWWLWHFSLSSNKLMTILNISLYIKVRITKICETYAGKYQSFQSAFSEPLPTSALRTWLVFPWTCISVCISGACFAWFKAKWEKPENLFLADYYIFGEKNTYTRHISISYFIEKLFRLAEVYCHLLYFCQKVIWLLDTLIFNV